MTQTREGAAKAVAKIKEKYGDDFFENIGRKGGSGHRRETRYFALNPEAASKAGAKGGRISRRGPSKKKKDEEPKKKIKWPWSK